MGQCDREDYPISPIQALFGVFYSARSAADWRKEKHHLATSCRDVGRR